MQDGYKTTLTVLTGVFSKNTCVRVYVHTCVYNTRARTRKRSSGNPPLQDCETTLFY